MATTMTNSIAPSAALQRRSEGCAPWNHPLARRGRTNPRNQRGRSRVLPNTCSTSTPPCVAECVTRARVSNVSTTQQRSSPIRTTTLPTTKSRTPPPRQTQSPVKTLLSAPIVVASLEAPKPLAVSVEPLAPKVAEAEVLDVIAPVIEPVVPKAVQALRDGVKETKVLTMELCGEGIGGAYFVRNNDAVLGVFKPSDEEPGAINNPKDETSSHSSGIKPGSGWIREVAAFKLDHGGFAGVPATIEHRAPAEFFPKASDDSGFKTGSLQRFVRSADGSSCIASCDVGPGRFPTADVHRIGLLDLRLLNCDRHGGNILVQKTASGETRLVPIDHTYCLPVTLEALEYEWLFWPQSKLPFGEEEVAYVEGLDLEADLRALRSMGIEDSALDLFHAATLVVQIGVRVGCCLRTLGNFVRRERLGEPSGLENALKESTVDGVIDFSRLGSVLDAALTPLATSQPPTTPPYVRATLESRFSDC